MRSATIPARLVKSGDIIWIDDEYCTVKTVFNHHSVRNPRITILVETSQGKEKRGMFSPNELVGVHIPPKEEFEAKERGVTWSVYQGERAILHNLREWSAKAIAGVLNDESSRGEAPTIQSAIEKGIFDRLKIQFKGTADIRIDKRVTGDISVRDLRTDKHWIVKIEEVR